MTDYQQFLLMISPVFVLMVLALGVGASVIRDERRKHRKDRP